MLIISNSPPHISLLCAFLEGLIYVIGKIMIHALCRKICHHKEAYVRRAVLFAASSVLVSLHPSFVASALTEGNLEVSKGLEWVRTWALDVVESDTDRECYTVSKKLWCST